jgi:hypothetical protein
VKIIFYAVLLLMVAICSCSRTGGVVVEHRTSWPEAEDRWASLRRDLITGHFWTALKYSGKQVAFSGQPIFDADHNPILVSIFETPIWCHVELEANDLRQIQQERHQSDCATVEVLGRVKTINWYTKHVTLTSLQSHVDGGQ